MDMLPFKMDELFENPLKINYLLQMYVLSTNNKVILHYALVLQMQIMKR